MWGETNAKSGGRLTAIISVTYPEGSVCTVTNGDKTYQAKDTSGNALFNVAAGEWTVSCTDGEDTASEDVTAEAGKAAVVELLYQFYIFKEGEGLKNGITKKSGSTSIFSISDNTISQPVNKDNSTIVFSGIDVTDYATMYVDAKTVAGTYSNPSFFGFSSTGAGGDVTTNWSTKLSVSAGSARKVRTLDISNLTGTQYPKAGSNVCGWTIYNWWLE
jgi:hypothetical protein